MSVESRDYVFCAAGATTVLQRNAGEAGNILKTIHIVPTTTSPGNVEIKDGGGSAIRIFTGGLASGLIPILDARPLTIYLDMISVDGAWSVITGANVQAIAVGRFT